MITEAVVRVFLGLAQQVLSLGPNLAAPDLSGPMAAIAPLWAGFGWANHYLPVDLAIGFLGIRLGALLVSHVVNATVWLLSKAHVLGGGSS